jgi:hypothetical protein
LRSALARFSSRLSRSRAASLSASRLVGPGRAPVSCSACSNQRRSVSFVQPNFGATAERAAHGDGWYGRCSRSNRTARSRTSELKRWVRDFAIAPVSHKVELPVIPGRFSTRTSSLKWCEQRKPCVRQVGPGPLPEYAAQCMLDISRTSSKEQRDTDAS